MSNERKDIICDVCDATKEDMKHPPFYVKDRRIKSNTTWWKAQNGIALSMLKVLLYRFFGVNKEVFHQVKRKLRSSWIWKPCFNSPILSWSSTPSDLLAWSSNGVLIWGKHG